MVEDALLNVTTVYTASTIGTLTINLAEGIRLSTLEKVMMGVSIAVGVDALITPRVTGGYSLHQMLGITPEIIAEEALRIGEAVVAYAGTCYLVYKNIRSHI